MYRAYAVLNFPETANIEPVFRCLSYGAGAGPVL
jgi:hypothetical protein